MVPEQRVLRIARIGPEQVAQRQRHRAGIAAYYNANQATYGAKEIRVISQAVVPDRQRRDRDRSTRPGGASSRRGDRARRR